jgi:hypothetical protein
MAQDFGLSCLKIQIAATKKGPAQTGPFPWQPLLALLVALIRILLTGLAGLLTRLARLTLLLPGLLARLRLVLVLLLLRVVLVVLARLVLVGHVINSVEVGLPQPFLNPSLPPSFRRNAIVPKVSWLHLVPSGTGHARFCACKTGPQFDREGTCA